MGTGTGGTNAIAIGALVGARFATVGMFSQLELIGFLNEDPETEAIVLIGEIGGVKEQEAAEYIRAHVQHTMVALVVGQTAPPGRRMGHAGAVITGTAALASKKIEALRDAGCHIIPTPGEIGATVQNMLSV